MCKAHKFSELNRTSQQKAIEEYRQSMLDDGDIDEQLQNWFQEVLSVLGLPIDDIKYNFAYSQIDGVAFYGEIDLKALIKNSAFTEAAIDDFGEYLSAIQDGKFRIVIGRDFPNGKNLKMVLFSQITNDFEKSKLWQSEKRPLFLSALEDFLNGIANGLKEKAYELIEEETGDENITRLLNEFDYRYHADGDLCKEGSDNA